MIHLIQIYSPVILLSCTAVHTFLRSFRSSLRRKRSLLHPTIHPDRVCVPPRARSVLLTARPRLRLLSHGLPDFQFGLPFFLSPQFHLFYSLGTPVHFGLLPNAFFDVAYPLSLSWLRAHASFPSSQSPRPPRPLRDPSSHSLQPSLDLSVSLSDTCPALFFPLPMPKPGLQFIRTDS